PENELILPSEAASRVAGDVVVEKKDLLWWDQAADVYHRLDGVQGVLRMPTADIPEAEFLGVVSGQWHPESYVELAKALDGINPEIYKVETAGVLEGGKRCFISL